MSPLSDTTVLTASVTGTPLFTHIRYMMWTTVPAMIVALVIFTMLGFSHDAASTEQMARIGAGLAAKFNISPLVFIVPVITVVMIALKTPSLVALFISTFLGGLFALVFQPGALADAAAGGSALKGVVKAIYGTVSFGFEDKTLAELTESSGMAGMLNTIWLIICAMVFGGIMKVCRMLESITRFFMRMIRARTSLVASTAASGMFFTVVLADQYLAILLTGGMYMPIYSKKGYESRLLSRTTEDAVTVTSPLVPWSTCGMTQATMLSVPTVVYLPYCFFNLLCPLFTLILAATGIGIFRRKQ